MRKMKSFAEEVEKLKPLMDQDAEETYSFLAPLLAKPLEKPVVLYAAGKTSERIYGYLRTKGVPISAVCDKNKRGKFLDSGLEIISPRELYEHHRDAWIVVCTFNYSVDVITDMCICGIREKNILRATYTSNIAYFSKEEFFQNQQLYDGYRFAYDLASDDLSKGVVLDVLRKDVSGCHLLKKTSTLPERLSYFDFDFAEKEVFVQAGCFTGDTVEEFIKFRGHNPNDVIYTFEGDENNYKISKKNLEKYKNVHLSHLGLWSQEDVLCFFNESNGRSRLKNVGWSSGYESELNVISLDKFFEDKPELPTFIELDIEGAEPEALLGAGRILKEAKPKLAICVYHYQDHIYKIPQIIKKINPEYQRFRFVQTLDQNLFDTILFAD